MYTPWTRRTVGIEMEVRDVRTTRQHLSMASLHAAIANCGTVDHPVASARGYGPSNGTTWDVKTDSSCGYEVASPAIRFNASGHNADLKKVCTAIRSVSPSVDKKCGLHVHVDCRDFSWQELQKLVALFARYEPFFYSLCPKSRSNNVYCAPIRKARWTDRDGIHAGITTAILNATTEATFRAAAARLERRNSLNLTGWWRHGRVEFRLQGGTVDYTKIRQWVLLLTALVERAKHPTAPAPSLTIGQQPPQGFTPQHVLAVLGLVPSVHFPNTPATVVGPLADWVEARIGTLAAGVR